MRRGDHISIRPHRQETPRPQRQPEMPRAEELAEHVFQTPEVLRKQSKKRKAERAAAAAAADDDGSEASSTDLALARMELLEERRQDGTKQGVYNATALTQALAQMRAAASWKNTGAVDDWLETLDVTSAEPLVVEDVDDDFKREAAFKEQALESVKNARARLGMLKVLHVRPEDYFAEMLKTDAHMHKIKRRMMSQKEQIESGIERRKQRDMKKFGKQVQQAKLREREDARKSDLDKIKKWRKERAAGKGSLTDKDELPISFQHSTAKKIARGKRAYKDEKYGMGGKKRGAKRNTRDSSADMSAFNVKRNKSLPVSLRKTRGGGVGAKNRPGKARRANMRR